MDVTSQFISSLMAFWKNQLLGTFIWPGSTFSIWALALTTVVAALVIVQHRDVTLKTLSRALFPRRIWRTRSGRADMLWFAFSALGGGIAFGWAIVAGSLISEGTVSGLSHMLGTSAPTAFPVALVIALTTILLFIAYEFAYWLDHWAMHRFQWTWAFHQVHHSAESLSLLTTARVHPLETIGFYNIVAVMMGATSGVLNYAFGSVASPATIFGNNAIVLLTSILITHLQHTHLWVTFGPRWGRWLLGPAHHQVHHSVAPEHHNRNFGNCLTLFDRLFGTFTMPAQVRPLIKFGIDAEHFDAQSIRGMTLQPFIEATVTILPAGNTCRKDVVSRSASVVS